MNRNKTLVAVAIFGALLVTYLATRQRHFNAGLPEAKLAKIDEAAVTSIEVSGAAKVSLRKEAGAWKVSDPAQPEQAYAADGAAVERALETLAALRAGDFITERQERQAELELDETKGLWVKLGGASGTLAQWVFGKSSPTGGTYLRDAKRPAVFLTKSTAAWALRKDVKGWRQRSFLQGKAGDLVRLTVRHDDGSVLSLREQDGAWTLGEGMRTPQGFRFDPAAAQRVAGQLGALRAVEFVGAGTTDEALGFARQHSVVEAETRGGGKLALHLGKPLEQDLPGTPGSKGAVPARLEGDAQTYLVSAGSLPLVRPRLADLRDTSLFSFDPAKVTALSIATRGKRAAVSKEGGAWKVIEPRQLPAGFELDPGQVEAQLRWLRGARGTRALGGVSETRAGLHSPSVTVKVSLEGGQSQSLRIGGAAGAELNAKGAVDDLVYAVPASLVTRLEQGIDLFKKVSAPQLAPGAMKGLEQLPPEIRRQLEAQLRQRAHGR